MILWKPPSWLRKFTHKEDRRVKQVIYLVLLVITLWSGIARAQWKTDFVDSSSTNGKICLFSKTPAIGQTSVMAWLDPHASQGPLRLSMGVFGSALGELSPTQVKRMLAPLRSGILRLQFDDGALILVNGQEAFDAVDFYVRQEQLTTFVHEFTAAHLMRVLSEDRVIIQVDLSGTSKVIDSVAKCVIENSITGLPKPFTFLVEKKEVTLATSDPIDKFIRNFYKWRNTESAEAVAACSSLTPDTIMNYLNNILHRRNPDLQVVYVWDLHPAPAVGADKDRWACDVYVSFVSPHQPKTIEKVNVLSTDGKIDKVVVYTDIR